jgi:hypothetical protein
MLPFLVTDHLMQKAFAQLIFFGNNTTTATPANISSSLGNNTTTATPANISSRLGNNTTTATPANISSRLGAPFATEQLRLIPYASIMNSSGETPAVQFTYKGNASIDGAVGTKATDSGQYLLTFASIGHGTSGSGIYKSPEYLRGEGVITTSDGERAHYIFQAIGYAYDNNNKHSYNGILVFITTPSTGKLAVLNTPSDLFRMNFKISGGSAMMNLWRWR